MSAYKKSVKVKEFNEQDQSTVIFVVAPAIKEKDTLALTLHLFAANETRR